MAAALHPDRERFPSFAIAFPRFRRGHPNDVLPGSVRCRRRGHWVRAAVGTGVAARLTGGVRRGGPPRRWPAGARRGRGGGRQVSAGRAAAGEICPTPVVLGGLRRSVHPAAARAAVRHRRPLGGELLELCRAERRRDELFGALLAPGQASLAQLHVLVVEDVHWADEATHRPAAVPRPAAPRGAASLLLVTYRDDGLPATIRCAWRSASWPPSGSRPADQPGAAVRRRRCGSWPADSGLEPAELYRLTGGNPFYVTEVVQSGMGEVPAVGPRRGAGPRGPAERPGPRGAGGRRADRRRASSRACWRRSPRCRRQPCGRAARVRAPGRGRRWLRFRHEIVRLAVASGLPAHRRGRSTRASSPRCSRSAATTTPAWPSTPRAAGDGAAVLRYAPAAAHRAGRAGVAPRGGRTVRAGAPVLRWTGHRARWPGCTTGWPPRWRCSTAGRSRPRRASGPWRCGAGRRPACARATPCAGCPATMWRLCRGRRGGRAMAEAAVADPRTAGTEPRAGLRLLPTWPAGGCMSADTTRRSTSPARRRRIAESLGLPEVLSDALNTEGCAAGRPGGDWPGRCARRWRSRWPSGSRRRPAGRSPTSTALHCGFSCGSPTAEPYYVDGVAYCDEHDIAHLRHLPARRAHHRLGADRSLGRGGRPVPGAPRHGQRLAGQPAQSAGTSRHDPGPARRGRVSGTASTRPSPRPTGPASRDIVPARLPWPRRTGSRATRRRRRTEVELASRRGRQLRRLGGWRYRRLARRLARPTRRPTPSLNRTARFGRRLGEVRAGPWTELGCPYDAALALLDVERRRTALRQALRTFTISVRRPAPVSPGSGCASSVCAPSRPGRGQRPARTRSG